MAEDKIWLGLLPDPSSDQSCDSASSCASSATLHHHFPDFSSGDVWTGARRMRMVSYSWLASPYEVDSGSGGDCAAMNPSSERDQNTVASEDCAQSRPFVCAFVCSGSSSYWYCESHPEEAGLILKDMGDANRANAVAACQAEDMAMAVPRAPEEFQAMRDLVGQYGTQKNN